MVIAAYVTVMHNMCHVMRILMESKWCISARVSNWWRLTLPNIYCLHASFSDWRGCESACDRWTRDDCHLPLHPSNRIFVLRVHLHARVFRLYAMVSLRIRMPLPFIFIGCDFGHRDSSAWRQANAKVLCLFLFELFREQKVKWLGPTVEF